MPRKNFYILLFVLLICLFCMKRASYRDWVLIDAMHKVQAMALYAPGETALFEGAMHGLTDALEKEGDPWSEYVPTRDEKEFRDQINNRIEGIGVLFRWDKKTKEYTVIYPIFDSPAYKAGIRPGDVILRVDDTEIGELPFGKISGLIRGEPDSTVRLGIRSRESGTTRDVVIQRASVRLRNVLGETLRPGGTPCFTLQAEPAIAYFNMNAGFTETAAEEIKTALDLLPEDVIGLILDLRGNPGGYVDVCVKISDMFVEPDERYTDIVSTKQRNGDVKMRHKATPGQSFDKPLVVLIDGDSASASEILAACLQDFRRASIVGARSYGKGTVQEMFDLPFGSGMLKLTDASYWRPSGKNINRKKDAPPDEEWGVSPDPGLEVPVSRVQSYAAAQFRSYRANVPETDPETVADEITAFVRQIDPRELREGNEEDEGNEENDADTQSEQKQSDKQSDKQTQAEKPFTFEGTAPYFDPQLEKAIDVLKKNAAKK